MAQLVRWQFDNCGLNDFDSWWVDMRIESQLMCEEALHYCGRRGSLIFFRHEDRILYKIDLVRMSQQNLHTGRVRMVRRIVVRNFCFEKNYFHRGELKRKRPVDLSWEPRILDKRHGQRE